MQSIVKNILIDFQDMPGTPEEVSYTAQVFSSIKLSLSEMEKYEKTSHFNQCAKCKMVLTVEDKDCVYDWQEISSAKSGFEETLKIIKDDRDKVVWICSFCQEKNVLSPGELKFARNNSRVIDKPGNPQQKKEPILLVVFDISGSMEEVLAHDQSSYSNLVDKIKKTEIYQRIVAEEEKQIAYLCQKQSINAQNNSKFKYHDYLKKNKLLMSITESIITESLKKAAPVVANNSDRAAKLGRFQGGAKSNAKQSTKDTSVKQSAKESKSEQQQPPKTIGFMFFNSNVILDPSNQTQHQGRVIVCDTHGTFSSKSQAMSRERVNFDDFESLFKLGSTYGESYNTKINDFDFKNLHYNFSDCNSGQTALGPAIVIALGVISKHGPGSSIVVVTDGIANQGIFDQSQRWEQPSKLLKMRLEKYRCFLTVLQCRNSGERDKQVKTCIDQFCQRYEAVAAKIDVILDKNTGAQKLIDEVQRKMTTKFIRSHTIWTNEVIIKSQNPNVRYDDSKNLSERLLSKATPIFIKPSKFETGNLKPKDFIHHFMTQAVIKYENIETGQQSTFLSYIMQKIIQYNDIRPNTLKKLDNEETFHHMLEYLTAEEENYDISNMPLGFVRKTFRDTLMFSKSICNRSMRFSGRSAEHKEEMDNFFLDINSKARDRTIEEDDDQEEF